MSDRKPSRDDNGRRTQPMTQKDAARIQSHSDRTGRNSGFKQRAQRSADRRANGGKGGRQK